jgi:hypothetical protein
MSYDPLSGKHVQFNSNISHKNIDKDKNSHKNSYKESFVKKPKYSCCVICEQKELYYIPTFKQEFACAHHYIQKHVPNIMINNDMKFQKNIERRYFEGLKLNKLYQELENDSMFDSWRKVDTLTFSISNIDFEISEFINKFIKEEKAWKQKHPSVHNFSDEFKYNSNFTTNKSRNDEDILRIPTVFQHITLGGFLKDNDLSDLGIFIKKELFVKNKGQPKYAEYLKKDPNSEYYIGISIIKYTMKDYFNIVNCINKWLNMDNNKSKIIYS